MAACRRAGRAATNDWWLDHEPPFSIHAEKFLCSFVLLHKVGKVTPPKKLLTCLILSSVVHHSIGGWLGRTISRPFVCTPNWPQLYRKQRHRLKVHMSNLQSNRCLFDVANDMGLYRQILDNGYTPSRASGLLVSAIQRLQPNVFTSDGTLPFFLIGFQLLRYPFSVSCMIWSAI